LFSVKMLSVWDWRLS